MRRPLVVIKYILLTAFACFAMFPVVYMVACSFMGADQISSMMTNSKLSLLPDNFSFDQYYNVLLRNPYFISKFWNSVIMVVPMVAGQILVSVFGAYAFAKIKFPFRNQIFFIFILLIMMPYQVTLVPTYIILRKLNLVDTYASIILPGVFSTFGVFLLAQFIKCIPEDECEAAKIDGASHLKVLFKIIIPQCKGAIVSLMILCFADNWNMVEQPLILLSDENMQPLSIFLSKINESELGVAFACGVIFMLPTILMFLRGEKELMEGIQHFDMR